MQQNVKLSLCETTQVREHMQCKVPATATVWYTLKVHVHALRTGCVLFGISWLENKTSMCVFFNMSPFQPYCSLSSNVAGGIRPRLLIYDIMQFDCDHQ